MLEPFLSRVRSFHISVHFTGLSQFLVMPTCHSVYICYLFQFDTYPNSDVLVFRDEL